MKTKKFILITFILTIFALTPFSQALGQSNEKLVKSINSLNESCPIMIDQDTRLDNIKILNDTVVQYNYTLINHNKNDLNLDNIKKVWVPNLINRAKVSPDLKKYRENRITLSYNYSDKNGKHIINVTVTPKMYAD
jgi:hypothetical protein